ncbi:hypothetical protein [Curtobacterium pusillum]|uniref:hypothetical protein n=1 Tax=Curtobacterium pusillum TaxID=69373 RepID=UPI0011A210DA|nr:hypothetical protein [Curtobacterium pusillum]
MKNIRYGAELVLVCDAVAYTTIDYAVALAQSGLADRVTIPTFDAMGCDTTVTIVLGPGLPLLAQEAPDDELGEDSSWSEGTSGFIRDVSSRTESVREGH